MNHDNQYIVLLDNEQYGPYNLATMRNMKLMPDTLVKSLFAGDEFRPAYSFSELSGYLLDGVFYDTEEMEDDTLLNVGEQHPEITIENIDSATFYYKENGNIYGPFSLLELSLLDVNENTELSVNNMRTWTFAGNIHGFLEILRVFSGEDELENISLDKEELENVIKDQEEDLIKRQKEIKAKDKKLANQQKELVDKQQEIDLLKQKETERELSYQMKQMELELMRKQMELDLIGTQPKIVEQQWVERPTFDFSADYKNRYTAFENQLTLVISSLKSLLPKDERYVKVFPSHDDEVEFRVDTYRQTMLRLGELFAQIGKIVHDVNVMYDEDIQLLDSSMSKLQHDTISQLNANVKEAVDESKAQIRELENISLSSKDTIFEALRRELEEKKLEIARKMNVEKQNGIQRINQVKSEIISLHGQLLEISRQADEIFKEIDQEAANYFDKSYDLSLASSDVWEKIANENLLPQSYSLLGTEEQTIGQDNNILTVRKRVFLDFLNSKNLILRYNKATKGKAYSFVTTLLARMIAVSQPGNVQVSMIDMDEMCGISNILTRLNRQVYSLCVKSEESRKLIEWMKDHIADIKVNLLQSPINSLKDYNSKKENKEAYQILVIKGFPSGFGADMISGLNSILSNGIDTGINVILLIDEDELNRNDDARKIMSRISDDSMQKCQCVDLANQKFNEQKLCNLEILSDVTVTKIVQYANRGFEVREDEKVLLSDYLQAEDDWWTGKTARYAEIPFGLTDDKMVAKLKITQESGQNSAVVIGIPGSGKSVFLHSVICNAIVNYSPDELNLYLIDFSGVEFNTYANHRLPHAKVIAPEAEREFGLSILTELVEEGGRRMVLCRDNDVSNIVDLKARHPELKVPRLLVIIDEFQKLFEIENDAISRDANSKIHIIIQEFRKFGINLILATQRLPSGSILPKDLIANRVVFKSSLNDFSALISLPSTMRMPQLKTGECIYNSESGSQYDNTRVKGFFISMNDINALLDKVYALGERKGFANGAMTIFRGNELPDFRGRRMIGSHCYTSDIPDEVGIYFGESIAINDTDVCSTVRKEAGNNILVIGGEPDVAQRIAYYATLSATTAHNDDSASFYVFNFVRGSEDEIDEMNDMFLSLPFNVKMANKLNEVTEYLTEIKEEIELRKEDETRPMNHIYISFYAFQLARMFDRGGRRGDDVSDCGKLLDYILNIGPTYGAFIILQVDNLESLSRIGNQMNRFNYRIALQMSENDSNKVVGSSIANKIFEFNRPSSKFRAYYRDNNRNLTIKFKPYK